MTMSILVAKSGGLLLGVIMQCSTPTWVCIWLLTLILMDTLAIAQVWKIFKQAKSSHKHGKVSLSGSNGNLSVGHGKIVGSRKSGTRVGQNHCTSMWKSLQRT